jgi:hypothetical protein
VEPSTATRHRGRSVNATSSCYTWLVPCAVYWDSRGEIEPWPGVVTSCRIAEMLLGRCYLLEGVLHGPSVSMTGKKGGSANACNIALVIKVVR